MPDNPQRVRPRVSSSHGSKIPAGELAARPLWGPSVSAMLGRPVRNDREPGFPQTEQAFEKILFAVGEVPERPAVSAGQPAPPD
jgi:hypothetical protein